jgi:hypothetical protein
LKQRYSRIDIEAVRRDAFISFSLVEKEIKELSVIEISGRGLSTWELGGDPDLHER